MKVILLPNIYDSTKLSHVHFMYTTLTQLYIAEQRKREIELKYFLQIATHSQSINCEDLAA